MTETCKIQWVVDGKPTPHDAPAIGRVRCAHYRYVMGRRTDAFERWSDWFPICAEHAERLKEPGMDEWIFEPLERGPYND